MRRTPLRRGFTLREMFAVITIIGVLLALVVPAIRIARESARRSECERNLKMTGIALLNYHDTFSMFPMGAMHSGPNPNGEPPSEAGLGPAWWFGVSPFYCYRSLYDRIVETQKPGVAKPRQFHADDMLAAGVSLNGIVEHYMHCPSSSLPLTETPAGPIHLPTYVGIAGGCDIDPNSQDYRVPAGAASGLVAPNTDRIYHNQRKGTGAAAGGIVTSSGMLPPCQHVRLEDCTDGIANTMIVAEQSDWLRDHSRPSSQRYHGDPGWTVGGTGAGGGWLSGTRRVDPVPQVVTPGGPPAIWGGDCWNIATVRYPPNYKRVMGATPLPGCSENHGINNPLQSAHAGGLFVGMADGSVQFMSETTDLAVLLRLAIRDDSK